MDSDTDNIVGCLVMLLVGALLPKVTELLWNGTLAEWFVSVPMIGWWDALCLMGLGYLLTGRWMG